MEQDAKVKDIGKDGEIILGCDSDSCMKCKAEAFCNNKDSDFKAINDKNLNIKQGDKVRFTIPTLSTVWGAFVVFFVPLGLFFAGYYGLGKGQGVASFLFGIIGFLIGGLLAFVILKKKNKKNIPKIQNIVDEK